ncbi:rapamycin-insensitive companion of mTOR isoform X2 [Anoplophora glabripennis]|uniref:rapamycin-insensitive companion of mTOR isoform X2 n=1 Tax=Anoplophora glabripennis TaxID=217634 RepID=UPI000873589C|nr:rapamycin-insensitive companion of mTOR isoform X2 [Anoplophora glabripennis]
MAVTSWRLRRQNIRSGRFRSTKQNKQEDVLSTLLNKDPHDSFRQILGKITECGVEEEVLFNYLNAFVKLTLHYEDNLEKIRYHTEDLLLCLRISLTHESSQIRTAGLRCIRHVLKNENDVVQLNKLLIPYLLARSLDLVLKNDVERIEAMKLMRKCLIIAPSKFSISMVRSLISLANDGAEAKDRLLRICLATLSELGVLNSKLFIVSGGVTAISRNLLECQTPKIAESLCGVLLLLLDKPSTRNYAAIDLHSVAAPFCDFHYKHGWKDKSRRDERELRLNCSRLALLTILRSWSGILHFCSPNDKTGFRAIVEALYLNQLEVRKSVLDLLYELLGLPQPEWSDEVSVALSAVDPCEPQASWRLNEGFVVAEGRSVLPHLAKTTPSTTDMHLSLLLYCFLESGLLGALTEVIATSDTFISVRATVLLGELLRLIQVLLPPGCCNVSPSLPSLLEYATKSKPQAIAAITALQQLHKLMKRRPASYSLHLDYIIRNSYHKRLEHKQGKNSRSKHGGLKSKLHQLVLKDGDDVIKETGVLLSNDAFTWDWNLIKILLKGEHNAKIDLLDSSYRTFVKKLVEFFMPSKNKYSHMDLGTSKTSLAYTTAGIELINFLIELKEPEYNGIKPHTLIMELFKDILSNITAITTSRSVHDCLFSPQHMVNTQCQSYFLFIGQFARTDFGLKMLEKMDMFSRLKELATTTNHDCYVKLIISSLEYIFPGPCREILEAVLTCNLESSRLYATQFLHILLRAGNPLFSSWAVQLLVSQLYDKSRSVYLSALATLHEACELPDCLEALVNINPNLDKLGEKGTILFIRFLSTESGYNKIISDLSKDKVIGEIKKWDDYFIYRYVKLAEGDISDALTLHQRNEAGKYDKRVSTLRNINRKDVFLPPHLYGQLSKHADGFDLLMSHGSAEKLIEIIKKARADSEDDIIKLKASIWSLGHLGSSTRGYNYLNSFGVVENIINLATKSPVYSIRATAFYTLGQLATIPIAADDLSRKGWLCTRHNRHEYWPIIREEYEEGVPLNQCSVSTSDDIASLDNPFTYDFENIDEDQVDNIEARDFLRSPVCSPDNRRVRQSTLPANRRPPVVFHKRSLSESKTFDVNNGYEEENRPSLMPLTFGRHRNSSMTESTTSGVSSCDSLHNKHGTCVNYMMTLSPIPSSSSLSTLQLPPGHFKRVSHRVSSNSATNSDVSSSLSGSVSNELSIQNLIGYNTMRLLRRAEGLSFDAQHCEEDYLFKPAPHLMVPSLIDDFRVMDTSFTSVFNIQNFDIDTSVAHDDKHYMGICLPKNLSVLFPSQEEIFREPYIFPEGMLWEDSCDSDISETSYRKSSNFSKHFKQSCLYCCQLEELENPEEETTDQTVRAEVLRNVERLANPVWNKQVRSHLLRFKQREPHVFRDLCTYSEVCRMISETAYRLSTRRLLHELFFDVSFVGLYEMPQKMLESGVKRGSFQRAGTSVESASSERDRKSFSSDVSSPTESVKTLDSLKLIFNENKFPIRKNTN